ncbi:MAG: hypothetical protein Fur0023_21020 [Bacteroidia bacterium]
MLWNNYYSQNNINLSTIDSCIKTKDYLGAALLYEKASFLSDNESESDSLKIISANYYKFASHHSDAIDILKNINITNKNDSLKWWIKYQIALNYYLLNDLASAKNELTAIYFLIKDSAFHFKSYPLHILILNELYEWQESKKLLAALNNYIFKQDSKILIYNTHIIDSLYDKKNLPKLKNPHKSVMLSTFIPGAGQIYSGNLLEGSISFLSCASIAFLTLVGIYYQYYFTAIIAGSSLWAKFYTGNITRAEFLAQKHNYVKTKSYNQHLKNFVIQNFLK